MSIIITIVIIIETIIIIIIIIINDIIIVVCHVFGVVYAEQFPVPGFNTFGGDHTSPILLAACSACVVWAAIELLRALRFHPVVLPIEEEPDPEEDDDGAGFF